MSVQTSYTDKPVASRKGQLATNGNHVIESGHANGTPHVGNLVLLTGPTNGNLENADAAPLAAITVDVDDILAATASAASPLSITSASTPALNDGLLNPARRITAVLNSHANWDATKMRVYGYDWQGNAIKEELTIPDAGNVTLTTHQFFSRVSKVEVDTQSGTAGSFTMGYTADEGIYSPGSVGILMRDTAREPLDANDALADNDRCDVVKTGGISVAVEAAVTTKGAPAFLRTATSGSDVMGQWRSTPATGFTRQPWARFDTLSDSDSIAVLNKVQ